MATARYSRRDGANFENLASIACFAGALRSDALTANSSSSQNIIKTKIGTFLVESNNRIEEHPWSKIELLQESQ
jgi:hypothetical protein